MISIRPSSLGLGPGVQTYTITGPAGQPVGVAAVDTAGGMDLLIDPRLAGGVSRQELEMQVRLHLSRPAA